MATDPYVGILLLGLALHVSRGGEVLLTRSDQEKVKRGLESLLAIIAPWASIATRALADTNNLEPILNRVWRESRTVVVLCVSGLQAWWILVHDPSPVTAAMCRSILGVTFFWFVCIGLTIPLLPLTKKLFKLAAMPVVIPACAALICTQFLIDRILKYEKGAWPGLLGVVTIVAGSVSFIYEKTSWHGLGQMLFVIVVCVVFYASQRANWRRG